MIWRESLHRDQERVVAVGESSDWYNGMILTVSSKATTMSHNPNR